MSLLDRFRAARGAREPRPAHLLAPQRGPVVDGPEPVAPSSASEASASGAVGPEEGPGGLVPRGLDVAAAYAWRVLLLGVAVYAVFQVLGYFSTVTVPLAVAVLLTAMLHPLVERLRAWGWHPIAASAVSVLGMLLLIAGLLTGVGAQVRAELPALVDQTLEGVAQLWEWLASSPLGIQRSQVDEWLAQLTTWVNGQRSMLAGMAASAGAQIGNFLAGTATALFAAFFFCFQGRTILRSTVLVAVPRSARPRVEHAMLRGWRSLVGYMRAAVVVALVDGIGIAVGAWALGVPLVVALFTITFLASFVPMVGAVAAGIVAVALALVTKGWVAALIMLGIVVLVQQVEGNVLQPVLVGQAAELHPLVVLLGLIVGSVVGGIVGALLSIPALAFTLAFVRGLAEGAESSPARRALAG